MLRLYAKYRTFDKCAFFTGCNRKTWSKYWYDNNLPNPRVTKISDLHQENDGENYKIAVISDLHLGSREQQLTSLYSFVDTVSEQDISTLLICGDIVEGLMPRQGASQSRFLHGIDDIFEYTTSVFDYFVDRFSLIGIINGNHDNSLNGRSYGFDISYNLSQIYSNIYYNKEPEDGMNPMAIDGGIKVVMHHGVGGCAQNLSTRTRNLSAKYLNYSSDWDFLFAGHCHGTSEDYWLGKWTWSCGCFQSITPYLVSKLLVPRVEGMVISYDVTDSGSVSNVQKTSYNYDNQIRKKDW